MTPNKIPGAYYLFGIFCCLFVILLVTVEMHNGKFWTNDFVVYYGATTDFFRGNDPYAHNYGLSTGFFKYTPTTLYFFLPLSWLNFHAAQLAHVVVLTVSLITSVSLLHYLNFGRAAQKMRYGLVYAGFGFIAVHLAREFHLGNINLLLLFLFSAGLIAFQSGKDITAAVFWSFMVVFKPIVILAVIPLFIYQKWKIIAVMSLLGIFFAVLPAFHLGINGATDLWQQWFHAIAAHGDYLQSQNSLRYLLRYYTGIRSEWGASLVVLMALVATMIRTRLKHTRFTVTDWIVVCFAFCPNFFITDTEHFLLSLPLIFLLLVELIREQKAGWWVAFGIGTLFFAFNSNDLLGKELNGTLANLGLPGIANMWFILLLILLKSKKTEDTETREDLLQPVS